MVLSCGGDVRGLIHYSLPAENTAGPSVQRTRQPIWSMASLEDILLREESIPEFLVSICRLSHYMTSPSIHFLRECRYASENNFREELVKHAQQAYWKAVPKILPIVFLKKDCSGGDVPQLVKGRPKHGSSGAVAAFMVLIAARTSAGSPWLYFSFGNNGFDTGIDERKSWCRIDRFHLLSERDASPVFV
ncbi:unnamed protein product [Strongylus vulgaris]|uniref:Uncharacterized protein n=1 Tax=Strongylus vulgaris TaxID=40348 RepID=A0A3P7JUW2_STRVU|nr:unnamed protein product [Strongylus vulgaris]